MGMTFIELEIANPADPDRGETVRLLVDSGALYTVVPRDVLDRLGIKPRKKLEFILADGSKISRMKAGAVYRYGEREGNADVIFGEEGDASLLGVMTLEALGLGLNPIRRELVELPAMLGGWRAGGL